ncbi:MAG: signal peptidase I [Eubacteriales bacterium]|nr:signal peptidase I [Eubacteriales bacterium]
MPKKKAFTVIKRVIWGIVIAVFYLLCALTIWLAIDTFVLKSPVPSVFGYSALTVKTGSMSGTIEIGDLIIIKDTGDYEIGDIVTFLQKGDSIPTTHRIIDSREDGSFITKGDANNVQDALPVSKDIILGEVVKVLPEVGLFAERVQSEGWIYIVALLVILCGGTVFVQSFFRREDEQDKNNGKNVEKSKIEENEKKPEEK